jgi:hypothetical protein
MIKSTYTATSRTPKTLKQSAHGKLGIVTKAFDHSNKNREGQVFLTGAFSIMFLWDGGIHDKKDELYEVRWLEPVEKVVLEQE